MGYTRSALLLEWPEGSEFSGLEIRMRRLSIDELMTVEKLGDLRKSSDTEQTKQAMTSLLDIIGEGLLSWNYEEECKAEDGTMVKVALPATRKSLGRLDLDLILTLVRAWTSVAAVPLASKPSLPSGEPVEPPDELGSWLAYEQQNLQISPEPVSS